MTTTTPKQAAIDALAHIRAQYRTFADNQMARGFKIGSVEFCRYIEATAPKHELMTSLPCEAELTPNLTIGDHLAVTRNALGLVA